MKKKREVWFPYGDEMKLQFRKMKLTAILLFIVCVTFGNSFSQVRLTVRFDNTNIREVLQTIEEKTDYIFLYKDQIFDFSQKVSADFTDAKFEDVLKSLCDQTNISYEIRDRQIILKEKEATNQNGEQQPQKKSITGKVTDSSGGSIPGVSVVVKGTTIGMITDANGNYSLSNIPVNASLQFSFIGMKSQEVKVGGKTTINVKLEDETVGIEDVVVIGYGTVKKSDLTGSVASIKGNALTVQSAANPMMALQGSASGVRVVSSGEPGTSPIVKIRGVGTTGNSDPLYVVDGMMLDDVNFLNNNDIESIEVLKDASATAIYGSRGANGVILISTKKGSSRKPTFQLNFYEGIQSPQPFDLVTAAEYGQLINEGNIGQGKPPVYPNPEALGKGTQWFKEVTHQSSMRDYQLMFNQKTKNSRYYVSVGYYGNPGIVDKSAYNRYTIRLNNEYNLTDKIKVGHNISFISSSKENLNNDNVFGWLYRVKPTIPVYDENGNFNDVEVGSNGNVVAKIYYTNNNTNTVGAVGNAYLDINFLKDFTFRSSIGINMQNTQQTVFNPVFQVGQGNQKNEISNLTKTWGNTKNWLWENTVTYDKTFGVHHVNILGGYTAQENNYESLGGTRKALFAEDKSLWYLNAGSTDGQTNANDATTNAITSFLFRTDYSFKGKYLFTGTLRADASSRFPKSNRTGYFPSVALAWRMSDESFMKGIDWISNLKIRGSWGQIGNDKIGDFRYVALATTSLSDYAIFNNQIQRGSTVNGLVNSDITWEISESKNMGFELGLFKGKFSMEFDYYSRITKDMLVNVGVPATAGLDATEGNVGSVENKGVDLSLNWKEKRGDFWYNVRLTGTTTNNKVLDLGTEKQLIGGWKGVTRTVVGEPIGYFYGYKAIGVFQNQAEIDAHAKQTNAHPGDLKFEDINKDGIIDANDRTKIGESIPKLLAGTNITLGYKDFELGVDMYGSFGSDIFNAKSMESYSSEDNFSKEYLGRWTGEGTSNTIPRITFGGPNKEFSTNWLGNGNFWKIQNIRLAYTVNPSILRKTPISKAQVYISGNNLYYFSNYNGPTPEIASNNPRASSIDRQVYPLVSVYKIGATITF